MAAVYSTLMARFHAGAGAIFVCPAGYRAVVRYITAFNANAIAPQSAQVHFDVSAETVYQRTLQPQSWAGDELRLVLNPADQLDLVGGADVDMTMSGYLLVLP